MALVPHCLMVFNICTMFCRSSSKGFRGSTLGWLQFTKGHNSVKTVDGVIVLNNLCISPGDALYLYQVSRIYLKGFQSYQEDAVCILKISKGHNSVV